MQKEIKNLLDQHSAILDCDGFTYYMRDCDNNINVTDLYKLCTTGNEKAFCQACEKIVNNGGIYEINGN